MSAPDSGRPPVTDRPVKRAATALGEAGEDGEDGEGPERASVGTGLSVGAGGDTGAPLPPTR
ncbi:hypothetical protein ACH4TN_16445 [Streptomyces olivaceus]|uniref:hypothetical protein n=1 Tax=Streptomyces olivaceus TaxID=47716 RepID=UPI0037908987